MNSHRDAELLQELHGLIDRLLDAELSPAECQRLEELVCSSAACSDHYVRVMQMNAGLARGAIPALRLEELPPESPSVQDQSAAAFPALLMDTMFGQPNSPTLFTAADSREQENDGLHFGIYQIRDWAWGHWQFSAMALIASCLLALLVWGGGEEVPVREDDQRPPVVNSLQSDAGTVTIALDKIGTVTIEGPTDFRMVGPQRARLNYGNITVHVTEPTGHGFVVETPDGEVTDFGTKFSLNVSKGSDTKLIVREGAVDLRPGTWRPSGEKDQGERLIGGEAVSFNSAGNIQRITSIVSREKNELAHANPRIGEDLKSLISRVTDNLRERKNKKYYEIVPTGFREDALAYVDRMHEWNGIGIDGIPDYLVGADYVKPFNIDKMNSEVEIEITLSRPAILFVLFDKRLPVPDWLRKDFETTGDMVGLDATSLDADTNASQKRLGVGPGVSVNYQYMIWKRMINEPAVVRLGPNTGGSSKSGMYGIVAAEMVADQSATSPNKKSEIKSDVINKAEVYGNRIEK